MFRFLNAENNNTILRIQLLNYVFVPDVKRSVYKMKVLRPFVRCISVLIWLVDCSSSHVAPDVAPVATRLVTEMTSAPETVPR